MAKDKEDKAFDAGFYGEWFARFERMGEDRVRRQLSNGTLPVHEQGPAEEWLARKVRKAASRANTKANLSLIFSAVSIAVAIFVALKGIAK